MELELVLTYPDVIPAESRLAKAPRSRRSRRAFLEVGKRLLIAQIVSLKEQLNAATEDAICTSPSRWIR